MIKKSFALRVLIISFLFIALPLLIDTFIFFQNSYYEAIADAKHDLRTIANRRTFTIIATDPVKETLLKEMIFIFDLTHQFDRTKTETFSHELAKIVERGGGGFNIYVLAMGQTSDLFKIVASNDLSAIGTNFIDYAPLQNVIESGKGIFLRTHTKNSQAYNAYLYMARSIVSSQTGKPEGIIMVSLNVDERLHRMLESQNLPREVSIAILNSDGIVVAATDHNLEGQYFDPISAKRKQQLLESGEIGAAQLAKQQLPIIKTEDPPFFEFIYDKHAYIAYRVYIPKVNMSLVGYSSKQEFFGSALKHFLFIYMIYGLILIVGGGVAYWLALWISRPLRQLTHLMEEVGQGNLQDRFREEKLGFEINILGDLFNHTMDNLLENIKRAEDERVKKETYQRELAISRQVQRSLLPPQTPQLEGAELAAVYIPAKEVQGDVYGFLSKKTQSGQDVLILTIADVAGHGISSCLYSLSVFSLFRAYATLSDDVGDILSKANNDFIEDAGDTGMFLTVFMGMYFIHERKFNYYSCGHVPALIKKEDGHVLTLAAQGIALGLKESPQPYSTQFYQLQAGDILLLYTDGLIKAQNDQGQPYSENRLIYMLKAEKWHSAQELVDAIMGDFSAFTHVVEQEEEGLLIALKIS